MRPALPLLALCCALGATAAAAQSFEIAAEHAGFREYYCVTRGTLTNTGSEPIQELNGYFLLYEDGEEVGRSRGSSFLALDPGASAEARFEAPNAPCDTADEYHFIVNACMRDGSFFDRGDCADMVTGTEAVTTVVPRE